MVNAPYESPWAPKHTSLMLTLCQEGTKTNANKQEIKRRLLSLSLTVLWLLRPSEVTARVKLFIVYLYQSIRNFNVLLDTFNGTSAI